MRMIAHRGYSSVAPENTLAAFDAALRAGARAVEFDLQETVEGVPVALHDYRLERTTDGSGRVNTIPLALLRTLDAGGWFGPAFAGERVPTLEETLSHLSGRVDQLYIELKAGLSTTALRTTSRLLQDARLATRTTLISFDWWALRSVRDEDPGQHIGFLVHTPDEFDGAVLRAAEVGNAIVDCHYRILLEDPRRAEFAQAAGVDLAVYTVDDAAAARALADLGVGALTTNQITRLAAALGGRDQ
jgi:glycerophosphoryl diester phosphodiesterase